MEIYDNVFGRAAVTIELDSIYGCTSEGFSGAMKQASHLLSTDFLHLVDRHSAFLNGLVDEENDAVLD